MTLTWCACGYAARTVASADCEVVTAEFNVNVLRTALGERFLAIGRVQHAGMRLIVSTGEVRAFPASDATTSFKVAVLMQATIANVVR